MSRITLGKISHRLGDDGTKILEYFSVSSATSIPVFWSQYIDKYETLRVRFYDIEKPSSNSSTPVLNISTNGATLETGNLYQFSLINWTSTASAVAAVGATGNSALQLTSALAPFNVATAAGLSAECEVEITRADKNGGRTPIYFKWHFQNSASNPAHSYGSGFFASGPIQGVAFTTLGATTYTGKAMLIGVGRRR